MSSMFSVPIVGSANGIEAGWGNLGGGAKQLIIPIVFSLIRKMGATKFTAWRVAFFIPNLFQTLIAFAVLLFGQLMEPHYHNHNHKINTMGHLKSLYTILFLIAISLAVTFAGKIPAIIVFGDSSVDAGNNNYIPTVARSNFEPYGRDFVGGKPTGRFCNGKIATDFMSEALGLKPIIPAYLDPSYNISDFATGVTFASAATGYDNATSDVLSVLPLWKQLEYYKEYQTKLKAYQGKERATETIDNSLYLISIGTNDFLENYFAFPGRSSQYSVSLYQDFLAGIAKDFVKKLHGLGAKKISLGGLPPMGCMPLERATNIGTGGECVGRYNDIAVQFNSKLEKMVEKLSKELPGSTLVFSNPYEPFMRIIKNPSSFGFEVVGAACCATGMFEMGYGCQRNNPFTCTNADKYVFWDSFHPTQKTNHIMANALMNSTFPHFL